MRTPHEDLKRQPWDPCPTATKKYETSTRRPPFDRPVPIVLVTMLESCLLKCPKNNLNKDMFCVSRRKCHTINYIEILQLLRHQFLL